MEKIDFEYIRKYNEMRAGLFKFVKNYLMAHFSEELGSIDSWSINDDFLYIEWYNEEEDSDEETCIPTKEFFEFVEKIQKMEAMEIKK